MRSASLELLALGEGEDSRTELRPGEQGMVAMKRTRRGRSLGERISGCQVEMSRKALCVWGAAGSRWAKGSWRVDSSRKWDPVNRKEMGSKLGRPTPPPGLTP